LKEQHAVPVRDRYAVKDLETVLEEIYRVLLSTALYSTAIFGSHDGPDRLGFSAEEWIETYEMGDRHGSEVFGTREGIEVNGKFLLECHEQLEIWDKQAVELWCPGQDAQDEYDRELLLSVLAEMETGLLGIFEEIVSPSGVSCVVQSLIPKQYQTARDPTSPQSTGSISFCFALLQSLLRRPPLRNNSLSLDSCHLLDVLLLFRAPAIVHWE